MAPEPRRGLLDDVVENEEEPFLPDDPLPKESSAMQDRLRIKVIVIIAILILSVETGASMMSGPTTRIFEAITCKQYYESHDPSQIGSNGKIPEELCKLESIQSEIAFVKGYAELFDGLIGLVLAIPYGRLADKYGRKPVLNLSIPGFLLNVIFTMAILWFPGIFPLRMVWLSSLFYICGGGIVVAGAMVWTMMADVATEAQRAAVFFQFGVATMGSELISSALSGWLMTYNAWIAMFLGWGIMLAGIFAALLLPETKNAIPAAKTNNRTHELSGWGDDGEPEESQPIWLPNASTTGDLRAKSTSVFRAYAFILKDNQMMLLLSSFLIYKLSRGIGWFQLQYISKRYDWTLAKATFLMSFKAAVNIVLFVAVLPALSWWLMEKRHLDSRLKDMQLTKASAVLMIVGTAVMGLSPSAAGMVIGLMVQTLGGGFVFLTRSLITTMVRPEQTARLYTVIELLQAFGMIMAGPIIAAFFNWGLALGGGWIGLPFFVASILFLITAVVVWRVRLPPQIRTEAQSGHNGVP